MICPKNSFPTNDSNLGVFLKKKRYANRNYISLYSNCMYSPHNGVQNNYCIRLVLISFQTEKS